MTDTLAKASTTPKSPTAREASEAGERQQLGALREHLASLQEEATAKGSRPTWLAFWDFDGTLIDGDITEGKGVLEGEPVYLGLMHWAICSGVVPRYRGDAGVEEFWHDYKNLLAQDTKQAYLYIAELLSELAPGAGARWPATCGRLLHEYYRPFLFGATAGLLRELSQQGVHNVIISASPQLFLNQLGQLLPLAPEAIYGINRQRRGGQLVDPITNYAAGKAQRVQTVLRARREQSGPHASVLPLFAAGNSWTSDGPMLAQVCQEGGVGLMVNAGPRPEWAASLPIYELAAVVTLGASPTT